MIKWTFIFFIILLIIPVDLMAGELVDSVGNKDRTSRVIYASEGKGLESNGNIYKFVSCDAMSTNCYEVFSGSEWDLCELVDNYEAGLDAMSASLRFVVFTVVPAAAGVEMLERGGQIASVLSTAIRAPDYLKLAEQVVSDNRPESVEIMPSRIDPEDIASGKMKLSYHGRELSDIEVSLIRSGSFYDLKKQKDHLICNSEEANVLRWAAKFPGRIEIQASNRWVGGARSIFDLVEYLYDIKLHDLLNSHDSPDFISDGHEIEQPSRDEIVVKKVIHINEFVGGDIEPKFSNAEKHLTFHKFLDNIKPSTKKKVLDEDKLYVSY